MSKYTADEVEIYIEKIRDTSIAPVIGEMLEELRRRLRQEEEKMRRDPVTDPRPGDRIEWVNNGARFNLVALCNLNMPADEWKMRAKGIMSRFPDATIIRRREVPQ